MAGLEEEMQPPIDVDDLDRHFTIKDFLDYIGPPKLRFSLRTTPNNFTVFSNEEDEEFHTPQTTSTVKGKIGAALHSIDFRYIWATLAQFWTSVEVGGRLLLKTSDYPFGMTNMLRGFCSYRKLCLNYSYIADEEALEEENHGRLSKGPPSRVFLTGLPEYSPNIELYSKEEFPLRDDAIRRGIRHYLAVPVFGPEPSHDCIGVLEFLWRLYDRNHVYKLLYLVRLISAALEKVELTTSDYNCHLDMENDLANSSTGLKHAFSEIQKAINMVCKRHKLPFAQIWTPSSDVNYIGKVMSTTKKGSYILDGRCALLKEACTSFQLMKGQGVVWRAFLCQNSCFCRDTAQLSITNYSFSHIASILGLNSSFAICLQSSLTGEDIYVLELFLPNYKTRDPRLLLDSLLATMKQHLKSFKIVSGQKLGKELFVEVLRVSEEDELDNSFVICQTATGGPLGLETLVDEDDIMPQHFSNHQAVLDFGGTISQSTNINEQRNASVSPSMQPDGEGLLARDDAINMGGDILSPEDNSSDNQSGIEGRQSASEVINRNSLEKLFRMTLEDAAVILKISKSTLKRKCRKCGIRSWPQHRKINKGTSSSPTSNQSSQDRGNHNAEYGQQGLNPSLFAGDGGTSSGAYSSPLSSTLPNSNIMTIKAEYGEEDIIKFSLPVSSRMIDLEKEVTSRLKLEIGNIKIRYRDEDDEWILISGDEDLRTMESMRKTTIRMSIVKVRG